MTLELLNMKSESRAARYLYICSEQSLSWRVVSCRVARISPACDSPLCMHVCTSIESSDMRGE